MIADYNIASVDHDLSVNMQTCIDIAQVHKGLQNSKLSFSLPYVQF